MFSVGSVSSTRERKKTMTRRKMKAAQLVVGDRRIEGGQEVRLEKGEKRKACDEGTRG